MSVLACNIPASLLAALESRDLDTGEGVSHAVTVALAQYLDTPVHTLFQVSTSGALVAGRYDGVVTSREILRHGDFGLGTFAGLDGEMAILDGRIYRARGDGTVSEAAADDAAPFAMVTRFYAAARHPGCPDGFVCRAVLVVRLAKAIGKRLLRIPP